MEVTKLIEEGIAVLKLKGNFLCEPDKVKLKEQVSVLLGDTIRNVVVDLTDVHCVNSEGLGTLVMALTSLRKAGGDLRLAHAGDMVRRTLTITQLVRVFGVYGTVEEAVASYKESAGHQLPVL